MFPSRKWMMTFVGYLAVALPVIGTATASAETTLEKIKRTGVMTSVNTFTYPPFGFIDNGNQVGLDVDLGNEIARRMGVKLTFEKIDFRGIIAALTSGRVDTLITALTWTPDRAKAILFLSHTSMAALAALTLPASRLQTRTTSSASASE